MNNSSIFKIVFGHMFRILLLALLFLPQTRFEKAAQPPLIITFLGMFLFSALCYALVNFTLSQSYKLKPQAKFTFCLLPMLLPLCFYCAAHGVMLLAYFLVLPLCIISYIACYRPRFTLALISKVSVACFIWFSFILHFHAPPVKFLFDVFQLYDLGQSLITTGHYQTDYVRNAHFNTGYSSSFPFLYPVMLGITDVLTGIGLRAYILLNYAACVGVILIIRKICLIHHQESKWGFIAWLVLLLNKFYQEVNFGGTTQFTLLLIVALVWLISSKSTEQRILDTRQALSRPAVLLGFLLGAGCMIRFDFLPVSILLLSAWCAYFGLYQRRYSALYALLVFILCLLPWIIYSLCLFEHPYIMDNSRRLLYIADARPSTFFPDDGSVRTLFTHPYEWLLVKTNLVWAMIKELGVFLITLPSLIIVVSALLYQWRKKSLIAHSKYFNYMSLSLVLITSCYVPILLLTGYLSNERYYLPFFALLVLVISLHLSVPRFKTIALNLKFYVIVALALAALPLGGYLVHYKSQQIRNLVGDFKDTIQNPKDYSINTVTLSAQEQEICDYIHAQPSAQPCLLAAQLIEPAFNFPKFDVKANIRCVLNAEQVAYTGDMIRFFGINYILSDDATYVQSLKNVAEKQGFTIEETPIRYLYKVQAHHLPT